MLRGWQERLRADGEEPDPRFTLANERTFLAWIRTALALVAGGIGVEALLPELGAPGVRQALAVALVLLGVVTAGSAFRRWLRTERAMRLHQPLPLPVLAPLLAYGAAGLGLVAVVVLVLVPR